MRKLVNNTGSFEDVKCALSFVDPNTLEKAERDLQWLNDSLEDEQLFRNRISVVRIIEIKIRQIKKKYSIK